MVCFILLKLVFFFEINMKKPELKIFLAAPRGFCAGVDRAIQIVEMALDKWARLSMLDMKLSIINL